MQTPPTSARNWSPVLEPVMTQPLPIVRTEKLSKAESGQDVNARVLDARTGAWDWLSRSEPVP